MVSFFLLDVGYMKHVLLWINQPGTEVGEEGKFYTTEWQSICEKVGMVAFVYWNNKYRLVWSLQMCYF